MIELIAEIGWNHLGDMSLAKEMIDAAAESGAHYAKFQTWSVKGLRDGPWDSDGRRDIYEKAELTRERHEELKSHCNSKDIKFLTSCFSANSIDLVSEFCDEVKIPSCECRNRDLVNECLSRFNRVFVSTGASTKQEAEYWITQPKITLLHCVSAYPCPAEMTNLPRLRSLLNLSAALKPTPCAEIGYSGHYQGTEDAIAAIGMGAVLIEKHFTLSNELPGKDNKFALVPAQFEQIADFAATFESMNQDHGLDFQESERHEREVHSGRWDNYAS